MINTSQQAGTTAPPKMPTKASVGRGILWSAGGAAATQFFSFAAFLLLARALDPDTFGLVALAAIFVALLAVVVEQGFTQALVQRPTIDDAHLHTAFWTSLTASGALALVLVLASSPIAEAFSEPELAPVLRVLSLSLVLGALSGVQAAILQRNMKFRALVTRSLIGTIAGGALGVVFALTGYGVWALVAQTLTSQSAMAVGLWHATGWRPRAAFSASRLRELWGFGLNVLGSQLVNFANTRVASVVIAVVLDKQALGLYTVASRVETTLSGLLIHTITRVSLATLSRFQQDLAMFRRTYFAGVRLTAAFAVPAFVGVATLAPEIAYTVLGPQWVKAAPVMTILAMLGVVTSVGGFNVTAIASLGYPQYNFRLDTLNALVTLLGVLIASPWGLTGIAVAFVARAYLLWPLRYLVLRRVCGVTFGELGAALWGILASAAVMAASLVWLRDQHYGLGPYTHLALLVCAGAVVYTAAMATLAPATLRQGVSFCRATLTRSAKQQAPT